jgi:DNA polymerase III gamma/tau subunit
LHLRAILLVKLAPPGSPLLAQILPEEAQELRAFADAFSEEDLLSGLDLLTRAEAELRNVTDPRVALDLVLLKLVQMRRLVPFAEVVARVERMLGGGASAPTASTAAPRALPDPRRTAPPPSAVRPAPARSAVFESPAPIEEPRATPDAASAEAVLARMLSLSQGRPSLAAPLRAAVPRQDGETLVLELPPDFLTFAREHAEDYRSLARKAGHALALRIDAGAAAAATALEQPSLETAKRQKLREEAEKEPAVQEALDLFDGRVVDVRETSPGREDA